MGKVLIHSADSKTVTLLIIRPVAGSTQNVSFALQIFKKLICTFYGYCTFVKIFSEILFKEHTVEINAKSLENLVPSNLFQLFKGKCTYLNFMPQTVVYDGKGIIVAVLLCTESVFFKAVFHGILDVCVKIKKGVVYIKKYRFYHDCLLFALIQVFLVIF